MHQAVFELDRFSQKTWDLQKRAGLAQRDGLVLLQVVSGWAWSRRCCGFEGLAAAEINLNVAFLTDQPFRLGDGPAYSSLLL